MKLLHRDVERFMKEEKLDGMVKDSLSACEIFYARMIENSNGAFTDDQIVVLTDALCASLMEKDGFYEFIVKKMNRP